MTKIISHIYFSPFTHESRAMRAIQAVLDAGIADHAEAVGYKERDLAIEESISSKITVRRMQVALTDFIPRLPRRAMEWARWTIATARHLHKTQPLFIQAHSLAAMPAAVLGKWLCKSPILYDAHELETERAGWGRLQTRVARFLERYVIRYADQTIVVSGMIAQWYGNTYAMTLPLVVRNMPPRPNVPQGALKADAAQSGPKLREALGISKEVILYVYLGDIGYGRGITLLIDAFKKLPEAYHFCALGYGEYAKLVQTAAQDHGNIHFHDAIPAHQLLDFIQDADVGLSLIEDISLSYRYCLPNKLFETRLAGLPVLATNLPEMAKFIQEYGGGWTVDADVDAIIQRINSIDRSAIVNVQSQARAIPTWDDEISVYLTSVRAVLAKSGKVS